MYTFLYLNDNYNIIWLKFIGNLIERLQHNIEMRIVSMNYLAQRVWDKTISEYY